MRLLPDRPDLGWTPYVWLIYLAPMVAYPGFGHASAWVRIATGATLAAFLGLYFRSYWVKGRAVIACAGGIAALALLLAPWNYGVSTFWIYAAAILGDKLPARTAVRGIAVLLGVLALQSWALALPPLYWAFSAVFVVIIGGVNIHYAEVRRANAKLRLASEEVERLAKAAERERIGRDLHDLLGHSLTLMALKAELAGKLIARDPAAAGREIGELETICREALREVRRAVSDFRAEDLAAELSRARLALATAGIAVEVEASPPTIEPERASALAMALREGVTNVIRHAGATVCKIRIAARDSDVELVVADDGRGGARREGAGLSGMRERIEAIGGRVAFGVPPDGRRGMRLEVSLPRFAPEIS
jgi:two-component system, NarL family, sensor histidine kinase DesK